MPEFKQPVSMQVTQEQFERDLKEPLKALGYKMSPGMHIGTDGCIVNNHGNFSGEVDWIVVNKYKYNRYFINHYNPLLFLALAAMTEGEDAIIGEYVKNKNDQTIHQVTISPFNVADSRFWVKPLKEELINHFTKKEIMPEKKIIGYKLTKPEYKEAALKITNTIANWENSLSNYDINIQQKGYINRLTEAGVLDIWFEPVYKAQFKVGDWVIGWHSDLGGFATKAWQIGGMEGENNIVDIFPRNTDFSTTENHIRLATPEEIVLAQEQTFKVGNFEIVVRDKRAYHKKDDITTFVKSLGVMMGPGKGGTFGEYSFEIKDVIFSKIGCEHGESKLSEWQKVSDALK